MGGERKEEEKKEIGGLSRKKKIALAVAGGLVGLIVLAYLGLCIYVGASRTILPGVWTKWTELSGMTREEAVSALDAWMEQVYGDVRYDLTCEGSTARLNGDIVCVDSEKAAEEAYMVGRSEPFLKRGAVIFAHLIGVNTMVDCPVELNDAGKQHQSLRLACGEPPPFTQGRHRPPSLSLCSFPYDEGTVALHSATVPQPVEKTFGRRRRAAAFRRLFRS